MRYTLPLLLSCLMTGGGARAGVQPVDTHTQAAAELVSTLNIEQRISSSGEIMVDQMIRQNPMLGPYRDVLLKWSMSFMAWDSVGPYFTRIYKDAFTERELRQLTAFYRTPLGQKVLTVLPDLLRRGVEYGSTAAQDHLPELQEAIKARAAELQKQSAAAEPASPAAPAPSPTSSPAP